jgi:hypothetical protein
MSKLSKAWDNSDIANFVNNWKRPLIGLAGGALGGAAIGGAGKLMGATGALGNVGNMALLGGLAGGVAGYSAKQRKAAEEAAKRDQERQQAEKDKAGDNLGDIIAPYLPTNPSNPGIPTPYTPPGTQNPPVSIEPSLPPTMDTPQGPMPVIPPQQPGLPPVQPAPVTQPPVDIYNPGDDISAPTIRPDMGNLDVSGQGGVDIKKILDETERARQTQMDLWNQQQSMKDNARRSLAETLNSQMDRQFNDQMPSYLEDLNTRGLLRSSALGDRLSTERSKMAAGVNEQLALQAIQDQYGGAEGLTGITDQYLKGREGAMSRGFSLEDWARQMQASKELGQAATPITPYAGNSKGGMQDLQAGMSVASLGSSVAGKA